MAEPAESLQNRKNGIENDNFRSVSGVRTKSLGEDAPKQHGNSLFDKYSAEVEGHKEDFAFTEQRICENYPFYGTLLKKEDGYFRRKQEVTPSSPLTYEEVKSEYQHGEFEVRIKDEDGEQSLQFRIPDPTPRQPANPGRTGGNDFTDLIRNNYEQMNNSLQQLNQNLQAELNQKSRKLRELQENENGKIRELEARQRTELRDKDDRIEQLKEEKRELEFDVFELKQELKYADADGGFDLQGMLKDAASNPELMNMLAPLLGKIFGGQPADRQPAALNGNTQPSHPSSANEQQQPMRTQHATSQPAEDNPEKKSEQEQSEPTQQQNMQHLVNQFSSNVIQNAASAMISGQPKAPKLKAIVLQNVKQLQANGVTPQPGMWVGIAKALIEVALRNDIPAEKAAQTIQPILAQFSEAAGMLTYIPAKGAAKALISQYHIQVTDRQQAFLVEVLKVFKRQLNDATPQA